MSNLGTNDAIFNVSEPSFRQTQTAFLQQLRQKHPNARIYVMRPFKGHHAAMTQQAVQDRIAAGDTNIRYVDTTGWLTAGDYQTDGLHPNDVGMQKIANLLAPVLAQ
ncbi:hypothetical protein FE782_31240 [Paenibacillus antri]|uniref:SGNH hydrolase-type esterase domain-containing protein n=1 Tax=Paenibacillus antri TaxID=2582848 RepID=A0A5R9FXY0_9BACL|nr:GDSL-type esterase/lipase family protein [Paenibacillus antri]TLS48341.1 hypothetical protein FE782_31240 [Paenibacillus antri]